MSFVGKAVGNVVSTLGKALGITPAMAPTPPAPTAATPSAPTVAPTASNSSADLDLAAQKVAASVSNGATSTLLTGGSGETDDQKSTSKILLGQ